MLKLVSINDDQEMLVMNENIRILILEDRASDAELVQETLMEAGIPFTAQWAANEKEFLRELKRFNPDLILSDYDLPQYSGAMALVEAKKRFPNVPFILVTGALNNNEDKINKILAQGANACVLKDCLEELPPTIYKTLYN
jgi:CheY-like chemotaxis protein